MPLTVTVEELDTQLTDLLAPRDPHDADDIVLEVKSGEGGEESALFAADLARMYIRYAERHGWTVTMLDETTSGSARSTGISAELRLRSATASSRRESCVPRLVTVQRQAARSRSPTS